MPTEVLELLLKFRANPNTEPINERSLLSEALLQNRSLAAELLLRFGARALGVQLSRYVDLEKPEAKLSIRYFLKYLPAFAWWGHVLPVDGLLMARCSELKAEVENLEGSEVEEKQRWIQCMEALQIAVPLLVEDEKPEVLASSVLLLRQLGCYPEISQLVRKQPEVLSHFQGFQVDKELDVPDGELFGCAAFSSKYLAVGIEDVRIYDIQDFRIVKRLTEAAGPVDSVALSDKYLAAGSRDKKVRIYDVQDFHMVQEIADASEQIWCVAFSDKYLATGSGDCKARIYDAQHFHMVQELADATGSVLSVTFSNKYFATGSGDKKVRIYDLETFCVVEELTEAYKVFAVAFSNNYLVTASLNVRVYDLKDFRLIKELAEFRDGFRKVALTDKYLAVGSWRASARIYDLENFYLVKELVQTRGPIAFSGNYLVTGSKNNAVLIYDVREDSVSPESLLQTLATMIKSRSNHLEGDKFLAMFDAEDFHNVKELEECPGPIAFSDKYLATASKDNTVRIYDLQTFDIVQELADATGSVLSVAFSDKYLAVGSEDEKVRIYDVQDFHVVQEIGEATEGVVSMAFSDKYLAMGRKDNMNVRIYDLEDFHVVQELGEGSAATGASVSTTYVAFWENCLVLGCGSAVHIYDLTFQIKMVMKDVYAFCLAFSDKHLAVGRRIFDKNFCLVQELDRQDTRLAAFSRKYLATALQETMFGHRKVRIYDAENFHVVKELREGDDSVLSFAFTDKYFAAANADNTLRIYDVCNVHVGHTKKGESLRDVLEDFCPCCNFVWLRHIDVCFYLRFIWMLNLFKACSKLIGR